MLDVPRLIVFKFGGGVLKDTDSLQKAVDHVVKERNNGGIPLIVVSAFSGVTNSLMELAHSVHDSPPQRELALLLTSGERMSMSLLAMALHRGGVPACSFTGSQVGIITTTNHCKAKILKIQPNRLLQHLRKNEVVIIAGFQGVSEKKDVTTLKRGGGDISAVALAKSLNISRVRFFKDVAGLFDDFPHNRKLIRKTNYRNALEIIKRSSPALLHPEAVEMAESNSIQLEIQHFSFSSSGTCIKK